MRRAAIALALLAVCLALHVPAIAAPIVTVFTDPGGLTNWQNALTGQVEAFYLEDFSDEILNPGLSIVSGCISDPPNLLCGVQGGVWYDRVDGTQNPPHTEIMFPFGVLGMGAIWDLQYPNFPGTGLKVTITLELAGGGDYILSEELNRMWSGVFWGFVSSEPFLKATLSNGSYDALFETFTMDDLRYAETRDEPGPDVPEPATMILTAAGLLGLALRRFAATLRG